MDKYLSAKYYQDNKERLKKTCEQYKSLSTEENGKKWQYGHEQYKNLSEDVKQKLT